MGTVFESVDKRMIATKELVVRENDDDRTFFYYFFFFCYFFFVLIYHNKSSVGSHGFKQRCSIVVDNIVDQGPSESSSTRFRDWKMVNYRTIRIVVAVLCVQIRWANVSSIARVSYLKLTRNNRGSDYLIDQSITFSLANGSLHLYRLRSHRVTIYQLRLRSLSFAFV